MLQFWLSGSEAVQSRIAAAVDSVAASWRDFLSRLESPSAPRPARQFAGLQMLEPRTLFSSIGVSDQTLTLTGDANQSNTLFVLAGANNTIIAAVNGTTQTFDASTIASIVINGGDSGNMIIESPSIATPTTIHGGAGADYISAGHTASVDGKSGSDSIFIDLVKISADVWNATGLITDPSSSNPGVSSSGGSTSGNSSSTGSDGSSSSASGSCRNKSNGSSTRKSGIPRPTPPPVPPPPPVQPPPPVTPPLVTPPPPQGSLHPVISITAGRNLLPGQSVHVQALNSNFGGGTAISDIIQWNFGDTGSAYNQIVGFNAAHAYDHPGTYTVKLTLTTPGGATATATAQVTVAQDTRPIIYVSASGNDNNNGSSANQAVRSIARAQQLLGDNMQVLFHDGDTFTTNSRYGLNILGWDNVTVGSYGQGHQPILMYNGPHATGSLISVQPGTQNLVVQGLTFDTIYTHNGDTVSVPWAVGPTGDNITIRGNTFLNVEDGVMMNSVPSDVLVQDNSVPDPAALNAYFAWVQGHDIAIVGNSVTNSTGESLIRIAGADRVLVADNNLANVAGYGPNDGVKGSVAVQEGTYAYVYANNVTSGPIGMGPIGSLNASPNNSFQYGVFDSNITHNIVIVFQPGAHDVMARNNVVYTDGTSGFLINAQQISTNSLGQQINWQVQNASFIHNTVIDSVAMGGFLTESNGSARNIVMDNNLFVDPHYQTGAGQGLVQVDNNDLSSFSEIKDNVWAVPVTSNWTQGGYFYVNVHGGVRSGYLTPAEWAAMGVPQGDVYENVTLGSIYSVIANGFVAGSSLPTGL